MANVYSSVLYLFKLILIIAGFINLSALSAQSHPVKELSPGVFYYFGDELQQKSANCLWVVFKDYVLVVDANYPWGAEEIIGEIRKTTDKPIRFVFNTHYHHDHTFGNSVFVDAGAIVVASAETANEMHTLGQVEWDRGTSYSGRNMKSYRREFPSLTFDDRLIFDDGIHRVELIKMGPAHTGGDAVAFLPKEKILATGDLCVNGNPWGNNVADKHVQYDLWLKVLDTLASWDVQTVIPGHGDPGPVLILKQQRDYLDDMLQQVRTGIQTGKSIEELIKTIDLSRHPVRGSNKVSNERSIKAMYNKVKAEDKDKDKVKVKN